MSANSKTSVIIIVNMKLFNSALLVAAVSGRALFAFASEEFYTLTGTKADGSTVSMESMRGKVGELNDVMRMPEHSS